MHLLVLSSNWHSVRKVLLKLCLPRQNKEQKCSDYIILKLSTITQLHAGYIGGKRIFI